MMTKRGRKKSNTNKTKKQKTTTTTTAAAPVQKSIKWASQDDLIARRCTSDCTNKYTQFLIGS